MATSTLSDALAGLNFGVGDTGYGIAANSLAAMAPKLINPYGSVGQNLGVGLGSVLLTALLQYQGKKSALEDSLQSNRIANDLMATTSTPEERTAYIENLSNQGVDSNVIGKLSTLATALTQSDKEQAIATAARKEATLQDAYAKFAAEQGVPVESVPEIWKMRKEEADAIARGEETGKPVFQTKEDKKAQQDLLIKNREDVEKERTRISSDPLTRSFNEAKSALIAARNIADLKSEAGVNALIKLSERTINPDNQVTLQEADRTGKADTVKNQWAGWYRKNFNTTTGTVDGAALASLSPAATQELLSISQMVVDAMGKQYNSKVTNGVATLRSLGVPSSMATAKNLSDIGLHLTADESKAKTAEIQSLKTAAAQAMASGRDQTEKEAMAKKALDKIAEIQAELSDFSRD